MFQTILASKAFALAKKYWQVLAGVASAIMLFVLKRNYDKNLKSKTVKEIESIAREEQAIEQQALNDASEAVTISHMSNPIPSDWAKLEQLSKNASVTPKLKAKKDTFLKKLRPKN